MKYYTQIYIPLYASDIGLQANWELFFIVFLYVVLVALSLNMLD